ncbi:hypothetical protein GQ457_05G019490 [Hibiscus cannabinus]
MSRKRRSRRFVWCLYVAKATTGSGGNGDEWRWVSGYFHGHQWLFSVILKGEKKRQVVSAFVSSERSLESGDGGEQLLRPWGLGFAWEFSTPLPRERTGEKRGTWFTSAIKLSLGMREYSKTRGIKPGSATLFRSRKPTYILSYLCFSFDEKDLTLTMEEHTTWFRIPNVVRN